MSTSEKHAGGRPSKYEESHCARVLDIGREGGCVAEMAEACDVAISTLYLWKEEHPEFSEALTRAQEAAEAAHSKRIRDGLNKAPAEFQGAANMKYMAQRFQDRWSEKSKIEHTGKDGTPLIPEVSDMELARRIMLALTKPVDAQS